jgi:hypothetical protein
MAHMTNMYILDLKHPNCLEFEEKKIRKKKKRKEMSAILISNMRAIQAFQI